MIGVQIRRIAAVALQLVVFSFSLAGRPRVAVVLSGGGALGFAHIGVIEALEEAGIQPELVVGTSMGSIVGAMYSCGLSVGQMREAVGSADWSKLFSDALDRRSLPANERALHGGHLLQSSFSSEGIGLLSGLIEGRRIMEYLYEYLGPFALVSDFDDLPVPFRAIATDLETSEAVVLGDGSLPAALRASFAFPGAFTPIVIDGRVLVDGGVVNNLPVDVAIAAGAEAIIAVNVTSLPGNRSRDPLGLDAVERSLRMLIDVAARQRSRDADLVIEPDLTDFAPYEFARWEELVAAGREAGREALTEVGPELLDRLTSGRAPPQDPPFSDGVHIAELTIDAADPGSIRSTLARIGIEEGVTAGADELAHALSRISGSGRVAIAHYRAEPRPDGTAIEVFAPAMDPGTLRLGFAYRERALVAAPAAVSVWADIALQGITTPGSRWWTHVELIEGSAVRSEFRQPVGGVLSAVIAGHVGEAFRYQAGGTTIDAYLHRSAGGELSIEPAPQAPVAIGAGIGAQWVTVQQWGGDDVLYRGWMIGPSASVLLDRRDRPVNTGEGVLLGLEYVSSLAALGSDSTHHRVLGEFGWWLPIGRAITLELGGWGVTDLRAFGAGPLPVHLAHSAGGLDTFVGLPEEAILVDSGAALRTAAWFEITAFAPEIGGGLYLTPVLDVGVLRDVTDPGDLFFGRDSLTFGAGAALGIRVMTNLVSGTVAAGYGSGPVFYFEVESSAP